MTTRTDLHRPSVLVPAHYRFVACDYLGTGYNGEEHGSFWEYVAEERDTLERDQATTGGTYARANGTTGTAGTCDVCGANAMHVGVFHYAPTNEYVRLGRDCAGKMHLNDAGAFKTMEARLAAGIALAKAHTKARQLLADANCTRAWEVYCTPLAQLPKVRGALHYEHATMRDIVAKLVKWGDLTVRQADFLRGLVARERDLAAKIAAQAERDATRLDLPKFEGRVQVVGKVLSVKAVQTDFGTTTKALVEHADGWKVYGTLPCPCERGDVVQFMARVERSKDDPKFGFYSRPTKGVVVQAATPAPTNNVPAEAQAVAP